MIPTPNIPFMCFIILVALLFAVLWKASDFRKLFEKDAPVDPLQPAISDAKMPEVRQHIKGQFVEINDLLLVDDGTRLVPIRNLNLKLTHEACMLLSQLKATLDIADESLLVEAGLKVLHQTLSDLPKGSRLGRRDFEVLLYSDANFGTYNRISVKGWAGIHKTTLEVKDGTQ